MKTCVDSSGRMKTMVTPSAASSRNSTAPEAAVSRSLPSGPPRTAAFEHRQLMNPR